MASRDSLSMPADPNRVQLANAIGRQYPGLTAVECLRVADLLLKEIIRAVQAGKQLGFFERRADGSIDISFLVVEKLIAEFTAAKKSG